MDTTAITALGSTTTTSTNSATDQLESEDFFKLLVTELQQQDPLEPTKTADMISQVSQIRSIEVSNQLTETLQQLTQQQQSAGVSDLIGKYVEADLFSTDGTTTTVAGVVTGVRFGSDGLAVLELDTGDMLLASDVTRITSVENADLADSTSSDSKDDSTSKVGTTQKASDTSKQLTWKSLAKALHL